MLKKILLNEIKPTRVIRMNQISLWLVTMEI